MNGQLLGIMAYVLVQLLVGLVVSRGVRTEDDYLLAGRRLGMKLGTFTIFATWFGAETCIGAAGKIYSQGLAGGVADPFGYTVCLLLMGLVFAIPLWRLRLSTLGDFFRHRYSPAVERVVVLLVVPASLLWAAAQIRAFGQVLVASSALGTTAAVTIAAGVVIAYTVSGGLLADAVTDLLQGIVLMAGLVCLFVAMFVWGDGIAGTFRQVDPARLDLATGRGWLPNLEAWAVPVCGSVLAQELVSRVIATRSPDIARRATFAGAGIYLVVGLIPVTIGLIGPAIAHDLEHHEEILLAAGKTLLPAGLYVLFAGALVSAILSTVDSALLAAGSLFAHNVVLSLRPNLGEATKLRIARLGVLGFGGVAYWMALRAEGVYELVAQASALGSAGVFVVGSIGLFTRFGGTAAALLALLGGLGSYVVAEWLVPLETPYLFSLACALGAYLTAGAVGARRRTARSGAMRSHEQAVGLLDA